MEQKRIFLSSPTMNGHEIEFIHDAFQKNWVAPLGENVDEFEKTLAAYVGSGHALALSAGTAAIHLALKCAGVGKGDIVFCTDWTFAATCNPITYQNAVPVFIDSEAESWNMDPGALEEAFAKYPQAKAVVVANLYGTPAKLDELVRICDAHHVPLIEDAAESLGSRYKGKQTGTFGKYGIYSFNGNKIITTSGGGMLVSDDEDAIKKARFWATQAREPARHYEHKEIGYNYRMSNIVAGIGRGQMLTLEEHIAKKRAIYTAYKEAFSDIPALRMNPIPADCDANCWLSCVTIADGCPVTPNQVMDALEQDNIESRPIWKPMHLQPVFAGCDFVRAADAGSTVVSEDVFEHGVCLPSDIKNTPEDMERVITRVRSLFR